MTRTRVPAVEGLFTLDDPPHLIGGLLPSGAYCFPAHLGGGDPSVAGGEVTEVLLSRVGRLWSWTTSHYPPPPPFVAATDPYEPIVIAAVELERERMIVLGQVVAGVGVDDLHLGQRMEVVVDVLDRDEHVEHLVWKWRPVADGEATDHGDGADGAADGEAGGGER